MKRILAAAGLACVLACLPPAAVNALPLRHGLELQGGMGRWSTEGFEGSADYDPRWSLGGGVGWFVEAGSPSGFRIGSGLAYRMMREELRATQTVSGGTWQAKSWLRVEQLALPVRIEHAIPGLPALAFEAGAQAEYILRAKARYEPAVLTPTLRSPRPQARIFETLDDWFEVTYATQRLGAAATAGLTWRTKLFSHDAAVSARYEHGLTKLWDEGVDRSARRIGAGLRVAW